MLPLVQLPLLPKSRVGTREFFISLKEMESQSDEATALREELLQKGVPPQEKMRVRLWYPSDARSVSHIHKIFKPSYALHLALERPPRTSLALSSVK